MRGRTPRREKKRFPTSLKTLGVLAVAIKNRTSEGMFEIADPEPALQLLADSLSKHPRCVRPSRRCASFSARKKIFVAEGVPWAPPPRCRTRRKRRPAVHAHVWPHDILYVPQRLPLLRRLPLARAVSPHSLLPVETCICSLFPYMHTLCSSSRVVLCTMFVRRQFNGRESE